MSKLYSVAVFLADRLYGGPEEGGWWYEAGHPDSNFEQFTRLFRSEERAYAYRERLERVLIRRLNKGRRSINSVLSEGEYRAVLCDGLPAAYPETRPHYE